MRYLCCLCVWNEEETSRGGKWIRVSRRRTRLMIMLLRDQFTLRWDGPSFAFVFHFRSPLCSTPHNTLSMTYELIVHINMPQMISTAKVQKLYEWRKKKFVANVQCCCRWLAKRIVYFNLRPSTKAKVNMKFIIFTLTIASQGQFTLKFITRTSRWRAEKMRAWALDRSEIGSQTNRVVIIVIVVFCRHHACAMLNNPKLLMIH